MLNHRTSYIQISYKVFWHTSSSFIQERVNEHAPVFENNHYSANNYYHHQH